MKIIDAFKRLSFTIGKQNKPNSNDVEALNSIIEFYNNSNKQVTQDNLLFAKLYLFVLKEFTNHYNDVNFANKIINKEILCKDLNLHTLKDTLTTIDLNNFYKKYDFDTAIFGLGLSWNEIKEAHLSNKEKAKAINEKELLEVYNYWTFDKVKENFEANINLAIQTYK